MRPNGRAGPPGLWRVLVGDCREVMRRRVVHHRAGPAQWNAVGQHRYATEDGGPRIMRSVLYARSWHGRGLEHATPKPDELLQPLIEEAWRPAAWCWTRSAVPAQRAAPALLAGRRFLGIEIDAHQAAAADEVPAQLGRFGAAAGAAPVEGRA